MVAEFGRSSILQTRMWPDSIVMWAPDFDEDARLNAVAKPFHAQALVAELAVEAFVCRCGGGAEVGAAVSASGPAGDPERAAPGPFG